MTVRSALRAEGLWPPVVPSVVLIEFLTGDGPRDAAQHRFLRTCDIAETVPLALARRAAWLRARAHTGSAVDALVTAVAEPGGTVMTGDFADLRALAEHASGRGHRGHLRPNRSDRGRNDPHDKPRPSAHRPLTRRQRPADGTSHPVRFPTGPARSLSWSSAAARSGASGMPRPECPTWPRWNAHPGCWCPGQPDRQKPSGPPCTAGQSCPTAACWPLAPVLCPTVPSGR
jgi:hypothetical protein